MPGIANSARVAATGVEYTVVKDIDPSGRRRWHIDIAVDAGSGVSEAEVDAIVATMRGSLQSQT